MNEILGNQTSDEEKSLYESILSWTQCCLPVVPATWKTEVGGYFWVQEFEVNLGGTVTLFPHPTKKIQNQKHPPKQK